MTIEEIEKSIKVKVSQYGAAQKKYHGDNALSDKLESEIDNLELQLKALKREIGN